MSNQLTLKKLLPKCKNMNVKFVELPEEKVGTYDSNNDVILIDRNFKADFPDVSFLTLIHELMHSTMIKSRTNRIERLEKVFGTFKEGSDAHHVEELITEVATMIIARKLNLVNLYNLTHFKHGFQKYNKPELFIPMREVIAAIYQFTEGHDPELFKREIFFVKNVCRLRFKLDIRESYGG